MRALLAMSRATNLQEFESAVRRSDITWNVLYADKLGNIAYSLPVRSRCAPPASTPAFPYPARATPSGPESSARCPFPSTPPAVGCPTGTASPPSATEPGSRSFGKQIGPWRSISASKTGLISLDGMKDIAKDIARTVQGGDGRESRYLSPTSWPPSMRCLHQTRSLLGREPC